KQNRSLAAMVRANLDEVVKCLDAANKAVVKNPGLFDIGASGSERLHFEVNRLFLNYLTATRSYLDYTERYLKRRFGDASEQWKQFEAAKSKIYDENFSYRFF